MTKISDLLELSKQISCPCPHFAKEQKMSVLDVITHLRVCPDPGALDSNGNVYRDGYGKVIYVSKIDQAGGKLYSGQVLDKDKKPVVLDCGPWDDDKIQKWMNSPEYKEMVK